MVQILKVTEIENFLTDEEFTYLNNEILDGNFPWYRGCKKYLQPDSTETVQHQHFHLFIDTVSFGDINSEEREPVKSFWLDCIKPLLYKVEQQFEVKHFLRAKINLNYNNGSQVIGGWHYDWKDKQNKKLHVATFYLNTNNGYTQLKDGTKIKSVANKLAVFENVLHTDVTHTDTEERIVLNLGFYT